MSKIILRPHWIFSWKIPRTIDRKVRNIDYSHKLWLDRGSYTIATGWCTVYGKYIEVFSTDQGETWYPYVTEDGKLLLGKALPELTEHEHEQLKQQGYYY